MILRKVLCLLILISTITSCKVDKKDINNKKKEVEIKKENTSFESKLTEVKDINKSLVEGLEIEKFGVQKVNDSIHAFVFKLKDGATEKLVNSYSFGIRGFDSEKLKPISTSYSPKLSLIENEKFLIMGRKMRNTVYLDSIEVYAYERKNWKKSGKLGSLIIRSIAFE